MLQEQTSSHLDRLITEATQNDYNLLANFLNQNNKIHRHLDWVSPLDWLGVQPFLIEWKDHEIQAFICTSPENKQAAWVRLFGIQKDVHGEKSWQRLLPRAIQKLRDMNLVILAGLALHTWFEALLAGSGFVNKQDIVVLEWQGEFPKQNPRNQDIQLRQMTCDDLASVGKIDQSAFPPLWQNSMASLEKAFKQTGISTVALFNGEIIGYQISTSMTIYGHLARLAVLPNFQNQGVAFTLVYDLLKRFEKRGFQRITVNTQSDNTPSLKLYEKFKFRRTAEKIPVLEYKL